MNKAAQVMMSIGGVLTTFIIGMIIGIMLGYYWWG